MAAELRVVGFDMDMTLGSFETLSQYIALIKWVAELSFDAEYTTRLLYERIAQDLADKEKRGDTRLFRPGITLLLSELWSLLKQGYIDEVFILSNNQSLELVRLVAKIANYMVGEALFHEDTAISLNHPRRKTRIDGFVYPFSPIKGISTIEALLEENINPSNILFYDDQAQQLGEEGAILVRVNPYNYRTPLPPLANTFFTQIRALADEDYFSWSALIAFAPRMSDVAELIHWAAEGWNPPERARLYSPVADYTYYDSTTVDVMLPALHKFVTAVS